MRGNCSAPSRALLFVATMVAGSWSAIEARADQPDTSEILFQKAATALCDGAFNEAAEGFEALADRGFVHPDASFDRSLSYLGRVRAGAERPGDLGRAAAALEETLLLRPDDVDAEAALDLVRAEVARRRARNGSTVEMESRPTFERAVLGLASESAWGVLAMCSSLLLSLGLILRIVPAFVRKKAAAGPAVVVEGISHLTSAIAIPIGAACLFMFALLTFGSRHLRHTTRAGVVVLPEAHLVTDQGILTALGPIPEAARVELGEHRGALVHVRWGSVEGWTQSDAVRQLATP